MSSSSSSSSVSLSTSNNHVSSYSQSTTDVLQDNKSYARSIGTLAQDTSRLSARSALVATTDKADYFSFKVQGTISDVGVVMKATGRDPKTGNDSVLSSTNQTYDAGDVAITLLDRSGNVVLTSSNEGTAAQKKAYQDMKSGSLSLDEGTYYLKVERAPGVMNKKDVNYAVQLTAGETYTAGYDTTEEAYSYENDTSLYASATALATMLDSVAASATDSSDETVAQKILDCLV